MKYRLTDIPALRTKVQQMTIRELIDQVCCPDIVPTENPQGQPPTTAMVFLHPASCAAQLKTQEWVLAQRKNVLFAADMEDGAAAQVPGTFSLPSPYALGKVRDPELSYRVGSATAQAGMELGFRWAFTPCVDLLLNPDSPMASVRCSGDDPEQIIRTAGSFIQGLQNGGMAATIKHFPGDGATVYDQHLTTCENPQSFQEWMDSYGRIYRELIDQGVMTVMPGHIALPCYDEPDPELGLCPPATLSKKLLTELLRGELGFEGIIISDALTMSGFSGFRNYYRACADFLKCGGDVLLFPRMTDKFYAKMEQFVEDGYLPLETLQARAYRVACFLQERLAYIPESEPISNMNTITEEVVRRSIEIKRDRNQLLPIRLEPGQRILHVEIRNNYDHDDRAMQLQKALLTRWGDVDFLSDPGGEVLAEAAESGKYAYIICTCGEDCSYGTNVVRLHGPTARNMMNGWTRLGTPVVFVSIFYPFMDKEYNAAVDTLINTYGFTEATPAAVADIIFGKGTTA